jgi:hypothetical protein
MRLAQPRRDQPRARPVPRSGAGGERQGDSVSGARLWWRIASVAKTLDQCRSFRRGYPWDSRRQLVAFERWHQQRKPGVICELAMEGQPLPPIRSARPANPNGPGFQQPLQFGTQRVGRMQYDIGAARFARAAADFRQLTRLAPFRREVQQEQASTMRDSVESHGSYAGHESLGPHVQVPRQADARPDRGNQLHQPLRFTGQPRRRVPRAVHAYDAPRRCVVQ